LNAKTHVKIVNGRRLEIPAESLHVEQLIESMAQTLSSDSDNSESEENSQNESKNAPNEKRQDKNHILKIAYEDPFKVIAGRFYKEIKGETPPEILVWTADVKHLQDTLRPQSFPWERYGEKSPKNYIRWQDISNIGVKIRFIFDSTHWGRRLLQMSKEEREGSPKLSSTATPKRTLFGSANTLKKTIKDFLKGKADPRWTKSFAAAIYDNPNVLRDHKKRAVRFLEMLRTVDGIFAQRYLAFPHEAWTWDKYDLFVLRLIWELISDEFLDGELTKEALNLKSRFSELKLVRKIFKRQALRGDLTSITQGSTKWCPPWLRSLFLPLIGEVEKEQNPIRKVYLIGVLAQTRGCGKPPPLVTLQSKRDFLLAVSEKPRPMTRTRRLIIEEALSEVLKDLPDEAFTGLATKARITVATSACWEQTQKDGGTLQEISNICSLKEVGVQAKVIDLDTGEFSHNLSKDAEPGEYIFWRCLEECLLMSPEERTKAFLVVVNEPGKARSVTKGHACLKIVLDLVNKICAVPLEKGIETSSSGMGKSHHGWNLFRDTEKPHVKDMIFRVAKRTKQTFSDHIEYLDVYEDVFAVSTDYKNATDYMEHKVAYLLGNSWMRKCGIPKVLRDLVAETAYNPRKVHYYGNLSIGEPVDIDQKEWSVTTSRGVMMGDPLTKVVLHLTNVVTRHLSNRLFSEQFMDKVLKGTSRGTHEDVWKRLVDLVAPTKNVKLQGTKPRNFN
jgi:hypothetical protein